ncbi:hypothetical protein AAC387_Pa08g2366 [Persea americana]
MTLQGLNTLLVEMKAAGKLDLDFWAWRGAQSTEEEHQMWAAQWYNYKNPRQLITSSGLGAMGFGLPTAIGAAVASPGLLLVDIDGDGSFLMNIQELATIAAEELNVKIMVLNNQHLGMVVQWEDWNCEGKMGDTYLGHPSKNSKIFPDFLKFVESCDIPAASVRQKSELRGAILKMLRTPGPYLLDVIVSHHEHAFPIIPAGGSFRDVIIEGSRRTRCQSSWKE